LEASGDLLVRLESRLQSKKEFFEKGYKKFKKRTVFVPFFRADCIISDKNVKSYWLTASEAAK